MMKNKLLRMDNVAIVVDDLKAAIAFFSELDLALEGEATVEGPWVDRIVGLDGLRSDIAMMRTPDGHARLELTKFQVLARLQARGAQLAGEVIQYKDKYRRCYLRGPEGIVIALAEELTTLPHG